MFVGLYIVCRIQRKNVWATCGVRIRGLIEERDRMGWNGMVWLLVPCFSFVFVFCAAFC